jgi:hypothetical protein
MDEEILRARSFISHRPFTAMENKIRRYLDDFVARAVVSLYPSLARLNLHLCLFRGGELHV